MYAHLPGIGRVTYFRPVSVKEQKIERVLANYIETVVASDF